MMPARFRWRSMFQKVKRPSCILNTQNYICFRLCPFRSRVVFWLSHGVIRIVFVCMCWPIFDSMSLWRWRWQPRKRVRWRCRWRGHRDTFVPLRENRQFVAGHRTAFTSHHLRSVNMHMLEKDVEHARFKGLRSSRQLNNLNKSRESSIFDISRQMSIVTLRM